MLGVLFPAPVAAHTKYLTASPVLLTVVMVVATVDVAASEELIAKDELNTDIEDVCEFNTNAVALNPSKKLASDADTAKDALVENEEVPNREPVIPLITFNEFKLASDPDTMTFFQLGILL
jgi:hypothetical protein